MTSRSSVVSNWGAVIATQNLPRGAEMDLVSRWLLIIRASVFPMTLCSGLIGGLLAVHSPDTSFGCFFLALVGLVVAHAANNMINDLFDVIGGVDTAGYVRTVYAPHPILSGLISKQGLIAAILVANVIDLAILVQLVSLRGWPVLVFALSGLFISVFYVAPPLKLKHRGLGEPGVAIVWGPLMIGGTYFVTTGSAPPWVFLASLPYAMLVTTVLFGKHVDKLDSDAAKGIRTLPVILGRERALSWTRAMMAAYFVLVALLVVTGVVSAWCLLVVAAIPRLLETLETFRKPPPDGPPPGYPIWPLWYVAWAFRLNRRAGGLFVLGLLADCLIPLHVSLHP
ncbi:MAG TPA: prenyltransferase [Candidatus Limnocylindrales bacterium]|nr:prenyltransferase [Candidatus Limnocylindrales bacterium]